MANVISTCALCGMKKELTFEHIPPKSAFNKDKAKPISLSKEVIESQKYPWDTDGFKYTNLQKGMGKQCLCKECNNNTGSWYGKAYVEFVRTIEYALKDVNSNEVCTLGIKDIYPLRIIKQIISMFCSINSNRLDEMRELREFVLNKENFGLDKSKYRICMYFTKSLITKYNGKSVIFKEKENGVEIRILSELTAYPVGFILYFNPNDLDDFQGVDITSFADCDYDDIYTIEMPCELTEVNDWLPEHYRSKEEVIQCIQQNKDLEGSIQYG